jgi:ribosomal protein S18 acetylase RimI-like enzyme
MSIDYDRIEFDGWEASEQLNMEQEFSIRRAARHDSQGILDCLRQAFEPYRRFYTDLAFADTVLAPATLQCRQSEMQILVAAEPANRVIGTVAFRVTDRDGHVRGMAVLPEYQRRGVATALLMEVEAELRRLNCVSVTLETTGPLTRAMQFYEKSRFSRTAQVYSFFGIELLGYRKHL